MLPLLCGGAVRKGVQPPFPAGGLTEAHGPNLCLPVLYRPHCTCCPKCCCQGDFTGEVESEGREEERREAAVSQRLRWLGTPRALSRFYPTSLTPPFIIFRQILGCLGSTEGRGAVSIVQPISSRYAGSTLPPFIHSDTMLSPTTKMRSSKPHLTLVIKVRCLLCTEQQQGLTGRRLVLAAMPGISIPDKRLIIVLGSSSIVDEVTHEPILSILSIIVETAIKLRRDGHKVVIVSSGAIAVGLQRMEMPKRPKHLEQVQVSLLMLTSQSISC